MDCCTVSFESPGSDHSRIKVTKSLKIIKGQDEKAKSSVSQKTVVGSKSQSDSKQNEITSSEC